MAGRYVMEWNMVWKDVTIGFAVAGAIAVFVPDAFFKALFPGAGEADPGFWQVLAQAVIGPVAAFFTFIGSMGNIPLAAVLFGGGVSFAGVMAFIFSDLVVLPVLRIQARYYGWHFALYVLAVFLAVLVIASVAMHYGFAALGLLPDPAEAVHLADRDFFALDYTAAFNAAFIAVSIAALAVHLRRAGLPAQDKGALYWIAMAAYAWLLGGLGLAAFL